jgi:hypothetical protein
MFPTRPNDRGSVYFGYGFVACDLTFKPQVAGSRFVFNDVILAVPNGSKTTLWISPQKPDVLWFAG